MALSELERKLRSHRIAVIDIDDLDTEVKVYLKEEREKNDRPDFIFFDELEGVFVSYKTILGVSSLNHILKHASEEIRDLAKSKDYTYADVADKVKTTENDISSVKTEFSLYEAPGKVKDVDYLQKLAKILEPFLVPESIKGLEKKHGFKLEPEITTSAYHNEISVEYKLKQ